MICNELVTNRRSRNNANGSGIQLGKYGRLPEEGRTLIRGWFRLACDRLARDKNNCFETFMFAWIAFNGWAACISGIDTDRKMILALMLDESLCTKFTELYDSDANLK